MVRLAKAGVGGCRAAGTLLHSHASALSCTLTPLRSPALSRPCTLLTLSELSSTVREVFFGFGSHTPHEPVGRCVAAIDLHLARVRPQGGACDHRGRQRRGRRVAAGSRRLAAADRGANSVRRI